MCLKTSRIFIFFRPNNTNLDKANQQFAKAILDTKRFFIFKGNYKTNHAYLPMHIYTLINIEIKFANKIDLTPKSSLLPNTQTKANIRKQHLDQIDYKLNPYSLVKP